MRNINTFKMSESAKLKHSYSLTSLSTRFLNNGLHNGHHNLNGVHTNHNSHHQSMLMTSNGHAKDSLDLDGSDDYGFLSFRDQDCSSKASGQLLRNSSFYSTSYLTSTNGNGNTNSIPNGRQPSSLSQQQIQHLQQHQQYGNGIPAGAASRQTKKSSGPAGAGSFSLCRCDCHGGLKFSKTELFRNHFNNTTTGKRDLSSKLNASSCQTLNLCSTSGNTCNGNHHHNTNNNSLSLYGSTLGMYNSNSSNSSNTNNNTNSNNNNPVDVHPNNANALTNGSSESRKNPSVRVRRTLSCYAKNPSRNDLLEGNLALAGAKDFTGSASAVANCGINPSSNGGGASTNLYQQLGNFTNPICEFSPYSSLSSNDLLGLRLSNGCIDKRFSSINNGESGLSTVFFHDNPVDCGCPSCFQTKLTIFQANQKKPSPPITNGNNNNNNKEECPTSPITSSNGNNTLTNSTNSTAANYSCKTQDSDITWPLTPEESVGYFASRLTSWELQEVSKYPQVWYLGQDAVRKINGEKANPLNSGFDDENGNYHKVTRDHLAYRYEILEVIGKGSFGQVIRATDHKTQSQVAIKIIRNKKRFHAQALVEVKILEHLRKRDHDNTVIRMYSSFYFRNHLCIVFELMSLNLYELIRRNHYHGFSTGLIRKFAVSLLKCLAILKKENIIHCDLKPENILLRRRGSSAIKVIDFGSSCFGHERVFSYIQSRFYRAPEVILGIPYTTAIDVWSLGCVLAELSTGYPLFPGENEVEQLACIMETLGLPQDNMIAMATRRRLFFDSRNQPRCIRNSKGKIRRPGTKDLSSAIKSEDLDFISFLRKCLTWDPQERLTPNELLMEPWITSGANGVVASQVSRKNYV